MKTDESMYKNFFLLYKLHQSLMMMSSLFLLIRFISKPNPFPHIHTHMHAHTHTQTDRQVCDHSQHSQLSYTTCSTHYP